MYRVGHTGYVEHVWHTGHIGGNIEHWTRRIIEIIVACGE